MKVNIHANQNIPWQTKLAPLIKKGLSKHGINASITGSVAYTADLAIILGPNSWKSIENSKKPYIMMNRKFLGFNEKDVHENVAISWNGFNGRGTFCVDEIDPKRFWKYIKPDEYEEWKKEGTDYLLFKQSDMGRSKKFPSINEWYIHVKRSNTRPLRIRSKLNPEYGDPIEFRKRFKKDLENVKSGIVLNSTVSTEVLLTGVPIISMDEGDPCYAINSHTLNKIKYPDRLPFFQYLAHCQWHYSEIENGDFWAQIYPKRGPRLCEWTNETDKN